MLYELRIYDVVPGRLNAVANRFANLTVPLWKKHGIRPLFFGEPIVGLSNQIVYVLEWESLTEREQRWSTFQVDPEWLNGRAETEKDGPLVAKITNTLLRDLSVITESMQRLGMKG